MVLNVNVNWEMHQTEKQEAGFSCDLSTYHWRDLEQNPWLA